jgi:GSH-dependent disulfide-bond oxidoreductase
MPDGMIEFYAADTPNNRKIAIMLEEAELDYEVRPVDLKRGEQRSEAFLAISPNNKTPAIIDRDADGGALAVFESAAILIYLAERSGRFLPDAARERSQALQWLIWQCAGFGPMLGQLEHFALHAKEQVPYALARFSTEAARLFGVLDRRLAECPYAGGSAYSIADMAIYPWSVLMRAHVEGGGGRTFAHVAAWETQLQQRPALSRGMTALAVASKSPSG